jgi:hypothetical protein
MEEESLKCGGVDVIVARVRNHKRAASPVASKNYN